MAGVALRFVAVGLAAVAWNAPGFIRADWPTRRNYLRAGRLWFGWRRLARRLDLAPFDQSFRKRRHTLTNEPMRQRRMYPRVRTAVDQYSVSARVRTVPGVDVDLVDRHSAHLRNAWRAQRLKVTATPGVITVRAFTREPLEAVIPSPLVRYVPGVGWEPQVKPGALAPEDPIFWGDDEDGNAVRSSLALGAHGQLAGVTRSGKSIALNTLLASAALMRGVRLTVIDPNLACAAPWWRTAYRVSDTNDPVEAARILDEITDELVMRSGLFWSLRSDRITTFGPDTPLELVVIDEAAGFTRHPDRAKADKFLAALLRFASQAAKFGGRLYLATQQPRSDVIPTPIRSNLSSRLCFRVDTQEDFRMSFPDAADLPFSAADRRMPAGVAVAAMALGTPPVRMRAVYLPTEACWALSDVLVADGAQVRELPTDSVRSLSLETAAEVEAEVPAAAPAPGRDRWRKRPAEAS